MQKKSIFKDYVLSIIGMTASTVVTCVFIALCVPLFKTGWVHKYQALALYGGIALSILLYAAMLVTLFLHVDSVHKLIFTLLTFAGVALIVLYIMQRTGFYETINTKEKLQAWLDSKQPWGFIIFTLIQFLQVCLLPIPSTITTWAGVHMFGVWWTMLFSFIGIMAGSIVAFYMGRYLGYKVVAWIVGREDLDKWMKKLKGKDKVLLTAMFLLPLFPDDVLCFVAGLTKMSPIFFIIMQVVSRGVNTFVSCLLLESIGKQLTTWWGITIWSLVVIAVIIGMIYLWKYGEQIENWFISKFTKRGKQALVEEDAKQVATEGVGVEVGENTADITTEITTILPQTTTDTDKPDTESDSPPTS